MRKADAGARGLEGGAEDRSVRQQGCTLHTVGGERHGDVAVPVHRDQAAVAAQGRNAGDGGGRRVLQAFTAELHPVGDLHGHRGIHRLQQFGIGLPGRAVDEVEVHALGAAGAGGLDVYLWPCNVQAWNCWCALQTQWRAGTGGIVGMDYTAVLAYLRTVQQLRGAELRAVFDCLQAAERAMLEVMREG